MAFYSLSKRPPPERQFVEDDQACVQCGYNLRGVILSGNCPECGKAVTLSLRGEGMRYASPDYIRSLDLGLTIILTAIPIYVLLYVARAILLVFSAAGTTGIAGLDAIAEGLMLLPSILFIWGYWKFTTPDPSIDPKFLSARNIARLAACVQTGAKVLAVVATAGAAAAAGPTGPGVPAAPQALVPTPGFIGLGTVAFGVDLLAWAALYFSIVLYIRWLARRLPDHELIARTKGYIWLLPLIHVVGCYIGWVVALIMYAGMFQTLRERTKEILDWQERGGRHIFGD